MKISPWLKRVGRTRAEQAPAAKFNSACLRTALIFSLTFLASAPPASAGTICYPEILGSIFDCHEILEASGTDAGPLYGPPAHITDTSMLFTPTDFNSLSVGTPVATDITDGQLQITISALEDHDIDSITIREGGVYAITDIPGAFAQVMAQATVFYWITEINDIPVAPIRGTQAIGPFTATSGIDPQIGIWSLEDVIELARLLDDPQSRVTEVMLSIDNTLVTMATGGATAMIDKKEFIIHVPEPSALFLLLIAVFILPLRRR